MKQKLPRRRGLSLLLALAMVLSLAPAAFAAETCPEDGKAHTVKRWEIVLEANCHEKGLRRGECSKCGQMVRVPRGRGKINIRCPRCSERFIKNT